MIVLKFGGSSLASARHFVLVISILKEYLKNNIRQQLAIVVSAPFGFTDRLISYVNKSLSTKACISALEDDIWNLVIELTAQIDTSDKICIEHNVERLICELRSLLDKINKTRICSDLDYIKVVSLGEYLSAFILKSILNTQRYDARFVDTIECLVANGPVYNASINLKLSSKKVEKLGHLPQITILPGFIASNLKGHPVLLGRNGSDYSAAALAVCLKATRCDIWKDVQGVFSADPKVVPNARLLSHVSYDEALQMAKCGSNILHPKTLEVAKKKNIPLRIRSTLYPHEEGTLISSLKYLPVHRDVKFVTHIKNMLWLKEHRRKISYIKDKIRSMGIINYFVTDSPFGILISNSYEKDFLTGISKNINKVSCITIVGKCISEDKFLKFCQSVLKKADIQIISYKKGNFYLLLVVPSEFINKAIKVLHSLLIEENCISGEKEKMPSKLFLVNRCSHNISNIGKLATT